MRNSQAHMCMRRRRHAHTQRRVPVPAIPRAAAATPCRRRRRRRGHRRLQRWTGAACSRRAAPPKGCRARGRRWPGGTCRAGLLSLLRGNWSHAPRHARARPPACAVCRVGRSTSKGHCCWAGMSFLGRKSLRLASPRITSHRFASPRLALRLALAPPRLTWLPGRLASPRRASFVCLPPRRHSASPPRLAYIRTCFPTRQGDRSINLHQGLPARPAPNTPCFGLTTGSPRRQSAPHAAPRSRLGCMLGTCPVKHRGQRAPRYMLGRRRIPLERRNARILLCAGVTSGQAFRDQDHT